LQTDSRTRCAARWSFFGCDLGIPRPTPRAGVLTGAGTASAL